MTVTILTDLRRTFGGLEADINKAAAATLNATVFAARTGVIDGSKRTFDRPRDWSTSKAWLFTKAMPADGPRMFAELKAKPEQAKVLSLQIDGGVRKKGDPGATRYDVPVGADDTRTDAFGGLARGALKALGKMAKKERVARAALAPRRAAVRTLRNAAPSEKARVRVAKRLQPLKWVVKSKNEPGIFVGTVGGVRGYWTRPARSLAAGTRTKGVRTVLPRGDNRPELLLAFADQAKYRPKLKYQDLVTRAQRTKMTSAQFASELARIRAPRPRPTP